MASLGNPKPWVPYMNTKDCSQGFCSIFCPQWCYVVFPPPPPFEFSDDSSVPNFSPLVIAIIGILASAFLLVSYYAIISKFCRRNMDSEIRRENHNLNEELDEIDQDPLNHEPWHVANHGLDEVLIKSITVCKYKKAEGLIEGTDCSVCLSEFQEDENLRLLPKCSHAFHLKCIDTWLRSHSNCPLCRANIAHANAMPLQLPPPITEIAQNNATFSQVNADSTDNDTDVNDEEVMRHDVVPKIPIRALGDLGNSGPRDTIIEIKDDEYQQVRRSVSMSNLCQSRVSIADVICIDQDDECFISLQGEVVGSSKMQAAEIRKCSHTNRVVHCVTNPVGMKRSFSSGRFLFSKRGRGHNIVIPL